MIQNPSGITKVFNNVYNYQYLELQCNVEVFDTYLLFLKYKMQCNNIFFALRLLSE